MQEDGSGNQGVDKQIELRIYTLVPDIISHMRKHDADIRGCPAKNLSEKPETERLESLLELHIVPSPDLLLRLLGWRLWVRDLLAMGQQGERPSDDAHSVARHCLGAFCSGYGPPAVSGPSIIARIHEQLEDGPEPAEKETEQAEVAGRPQHHDDGDIVMVAITSAQPRIAPGIAAAQQCSMYLTLLEFRII
ncbi:MAG: hypothetical protein M1840_001462 [Geoglossum simile]|nr:MAG: hypothetical protein M1840_001462 [Geoglossum simile]